MMAQKIESDKLFVKDVFQKWYRIPEYQRPYVWGNDEVLELLDDVYRARQTNPDSQYFLGSLVLKKNEKHEGITRYDEYDLLDGQQRLTTLFLITAVVRDLTSSMNVARLKTCRETIFQMANPDDNIPERLRIVFDIRDKVKDFVSNYIKKDNGTTMTTDLKALSEKTGEDISIGNMSNAILTIRNYFQNGHSIDEFFPYMRSNVLMIYVAAEELEDAFHLFTVMNTRGIKLRNSDILKTGNLAKIKIDSERIKYAKGWESIEEYFADDFDNFLSHLRTILVKQKAGYNLLKEYEENIYAPKEYDRNSKTYFSKPALLEKGEPTFQFIERYYRHYNDLFDYDNYAFNNSFEFCNYVSLMRNGLEAEYWVAPVLRYYDKYKNDQIVDFIRILDNKISSDWIIGESPTTRIENVNIIIKHLDNSSNPAAALSSDIYKVNSIDLLRVIASSIYGRRYARYLLLKLDLAFHGHTTKFLPPETISIEHILPQTPTATSQWVKHYNQRERDIWTDRLGNLILLSRRKNTAQSNLDYLDKKTKYFKTNVELFSNSIRLFNEYNSWNLDDLKKNHKESLKKLLDLYSISITDDELKNVME
jgi:uncharacterized protein with ParB-like and HNH nuclease domain